MPGPDAAKSDFLDAFEAAFPSQDDTRDDRPLDGDTRDEVLSPAWMERDPKTGEVP